MLLLLLLCIKGAAAVTIDVDVVTVVSSACDVALVGCAASDYTNIVAIVLDAATSDVITYVAKSTIIVDKVLE